MNLDDFIRDVLPLKDKIFRLAKRLVNVRVEAEDVTQDVYIRLWNRKDELSGVANLEAFAMVVTKNICLDKLKARKPEPGQPPAEVAARLNDPQKLAEDKDQRALVEAIVNRLPPHQRMIIQLRDIEGYEFDDICVMTGMNVNLLRVNLSRARKTIREELTKMHGYGIKTD